MGKSVGDIHRDSGFISTSIDPVMAPEFGKYLQIITVPKGKKGIYIPKAMENNKEHLVLDEQEFLLPRDTGFRIISRKGMITELEVI